MNAKRTQFGKTSIVLVWIFLSAITTLQAQFASGSGTSGDPYQIKTAEHLDYMRNYLGEESSNLRFRLMNDIDLTDFLSGKPEGWDPIGSYTDDWEFSIMFTGILQGGGHKITGLFINRPDRDGVGLFGAAYTRIDSLRVEIASGKSITGKNLVGGLIGFAGEASPINCCSVSGQINGANYVGGLIGSSGGGTITLKNSFVEGSVKGENCVGGLIGRYYSASEIQKSFSLCSVEASHDYAGGLFGYSGEGYMVHDCYAVGDVSGQDYIGGLTGYADASRLSTCYAIGKVTGTGSNVGGLAGRRKNLWGEFSDCYFDKETTGQTQGVGNEPDAEGVFGKSTIEMKTKSTYDAWDFIETWYMPQEFEQSPDYPKFLDLAQIKMLFPKGDGTVGDPYRVYSAAQLNAIRTCLGYEHSNTHFLLMNDIDLSNFIENASYGWIPIGRYSTYSEIDPKNFYGKLRGNGYKITGLRMEDNNSATQLYYYGLFGVIAAGSEIKNLSLDVVETDSLCNSVGGLVAWNKEGGNIVDCHVTGKMNAAHVGGGLVAHNDGNIKSCSADISINNYYGYIFEEGMGGLVGKNWGAIEDSYAVGSLCNLGQASVGGLVGIDYYGKIVNCYAAVKVINSPENKEYTGGLVGQIGYGTGSSIENCYFDEDVSGMSNGIGNDEYGQTVGVFPKTTAEMKRQATFEGWDFVNTWNIIENETYPFLRPGSGNSIEDLNASHAEISLYPNPVQNALQISASETIKRIELFNSLGKRVFSNMINNIECDIHVGTLPAGLYIAKIYTKNGASARKVVVIN